jgi:hypothetical protein
MSRPAHWCAVPITQRGLNYNVVMSKKFHCHSRANEMRHGNPGGGIARERKDEMSRDARRDKNREGLDSGLRRNSDRAKLLRHSNGR